MFLCPNTHRAEKSSSQTTDSIYIDTKGLITYSAIEVFNKLPLDNTQFQHDKIQFKTALKNYLLIYIFYSVDEFLDYCVTQM